MRYQIVRSGNNNEFYTSERCYILELSNHEHDNAISIARARVTPGVTTQLHRLNGVDERYFIIQGTGSVEVNGQRQEKVELGDVVIIPAGISQRIENTGEADLIFFCICTPRFIPENYESLEIGT